MIRCAANPGVSDRESLEGSVSQMKCRITRPPTMLRDSLRVFAIAVLGSLLLSASGVTSTSFADEPNAKPPTPAHWVKQLGHDEYLRREYATRELIKAGEAAVPALSEAIRSGDLETTTLSIRVLSDVALAQSPNQEDGAWGALRDLSVNSTGSRQSIARNAVAEIEDQRESDAYEALENAGVYIGHDDFAVGALTSNKMLVRIDDSWNGNTEVTGWLRWVRGIQFLSLRGKAVTAEVINNAVRMPDLHTIGLIDAKATLPMLQGLEKLKRINSLEIRYVTLDEETTDMIAGLPIRESLNLMGTGVTDTRVEKMRADLPGLSILHRHGGFLGVTCNTFGGNRCEITGVLPNSAASKAGLQPMDIVTAITVSRDPPGDETKGEVAPGDETKREVVEEKVNEFADLQKIINTQLPGNEIRIKYFRHGEARTTKLNLGRQLD